MQILRLGLRALATGLMVAGLTSAANAADLDPVEAPVEAAAPQKDSIFTRGNLLGDPFGIRKKIADNGLNLVALYVNQAAANVTGGERTEIGYSDLFFFIFDYDLEKSPLGIKGAQISATITNRNGNNVGGDANIGTHLLINEVFGQGNIWRLNHLWYQQKFLDDAITIKLGRLSGSFDFFDFRCNFQNLIFCGAIPSYITPNYTPFPGHTWAAVGTIKSDNLYIKAGIYEINETNELESQGFQFEAIGAGEGSRTQIEFGYSSDIKGHKGLWRAGVFFDNVGGVANQDIVQGGDAIPLGGAGGIFGTPLFAEVAAAADGVSGFGLEDSDSIFGWYILLEQDIWSGENGRGIRLFGSITQSDPDIAVLEQVAEIGVFVQGPFKARPQDELGWAVGRIATNDRVTDFLEAAGVPVSNNEFTTELYYSAKVIPSVILQPNVQYIHNPGGFGELDDVLAVGVKTVVFF